MLFLAARELLLLVLLTGQLEPESRRPLAADGGRIPSPLSIWGAGA